MSIIILIIAVVFFVFIILEPRLDKVHSSNRTVVVLWYNKGTSRDYLILYEY